MQLDDFRNYCLSLKGVTESLPFDENTLVFKVMDKMFALTDLANFESINVKCEPEKAIELRERYHAVKEGYHMSKKHWNTITVNDDMNDKEILQWVLHSYQLIVAKLSKKQKDELEKYVE
jgi:predicted DNA-binding protein (MmcQ/YjbR family)